MRYDWKMFCLEHLFNALKGYPMNVKKDNVCNYWCNKEFSRKGICCLLLFTIVLCLHAQKAASNVFDVLNLDYPGLENVKKLYYSGKTNDASNALLAYFREKNIKSKENVKYSISSNDQKIADEALDHKFFAHSGYQPSLFYGKDIDWTYWPVKDNELRFQLHRHKWFVPLGKAYRISGQEKYAKAWVDQYTDWIKKNPYPIQIQNKKSTDGKSFLNPMELQGADENAQFAWRPLEASGRLVTLLDAFKLMLPSEAFTSDFLSLFLCYYDLHAEHVLNHFSEKGNHLLMEAEYLIVAGIGFPEFKNADKWRKTGIGILNREINVQVYDDGVQYELDPGYHIGCISTFLHAYQVADKGGFAKEFSNEYLAKVKSMMIFTMNIMFPNYWIPLFSDAGRSSKDAYMKLFEKWHNVFPDSPELLFMATDGEKGHKPKELSRSFKSGGFYVLRNGWHKDAYVMILKAGPPAFWHNQPDNGTFDLYMNGRLFLTDSGRYIYGGDSLVLAQRDWFRQTKVHNTLTLNNKNIETQDSKCLLWNSTTNTDVLVVENPSYEGLTHRRSVFYVDKNYYVLVDEAIGNSIGTVNLHFQMTETHAKANICTNTLYTDFPDNNNIYITTFSQNKKPFIKKEEGWVSYEYGKKQPRNSFSFNIEKNDKNTVRLVTIISSVNKFSETETPSAKILLADGKEMILEVVNKCQTRRLQYKIDK